MFVLRYLIFILFLLILSFDFLKAKVVDRTLAVVNGEAIMLSEFNKIIDPVIEQYKLVTPLAEQNPDKVKELKQRLLDQMIDDKLLKQEAKKQKLEKKKNLKIAKKQIKETKRAAKKEAKEKIKTAKKLLKQTENSSKTN